MRILVPVDGSAGALRAVKHAAAVVKEGAEVQLVNVQPAMPLYGMVRAYMRAPQYRAACEALSRKALDPAIRLLKRQLAKRVWRLLQPDAQPEPHAITC